MSKTLIISLGLTLMVTTGCQSVPEPQANPAIVKQHTEEGLEELRAVLAEALGDRRVLIADTLFRDSHRLLLVRDKFIDTRIDEPPRIFELMKSEKGCFLKDNLSEKTYPLTKIDCQPREVH